MELRDAILQRRSIRKYTDESVSDADIHCLMEYAMAGPSACNKRPWEFYIIKNRELLEQLKKTTRYTNYAAPLAIIVAGNKKHSLPMQLGDFWIQDCSAAIENILLGAVDLGLGTCWCGLKPQIRAVKRVQELLGLEKNIEPLGLIYVGHPAESHEARTQYDEKRVHIMED